jgi:23S rRNA (cytosine1962-C5)-methyltransferase
VTIPNVRLKTVASSRGPWIFRKMVDAADPRTEPGAIVRVVDREGGFVAQAFWNPKSELALRVLTRAESPVVDESWLRGAVARAIGLRRDVLKLDQESDAWRVVFSEADHLPGLIVDRYADVVSCQVSSLGVYRAFPVLRDELKRRLSARVVHAAADPKIAKLEGFPVPDSAGAAARTVIHENGLEFEVDCAAGHKTGFFLDQRESRRRVRDLAKGRKVLDLYSYTGGFAINAAKGGARDVTAVDLDETAVEQGRRNAKRNALGEVVRFVHADAFDFLRTLGDRGFDLVVVDPAKQATNRSELTKALRYYEDLNSLAFAKAAPGGLVYTCSCTGVVSESDFLESVSRAARNAGREATFLAIHGAPADHPVPADFPQARYLKCVLARVL